MDRIASKTGGLFNLKEMEKEASKRRLINQIIELDSIACIQQGIPHIVLGFPELWRKRLEALNLRELKKELSLKNNVHGTVNNQNK